MVYADELADAVLTQPETDKKSGQVLDTMDRALYTWARLVGVEWCALNDFSEQDLDRAK